MKRTYLICIWGLVLTLTAACSKQELYPEIDTLKISTRIVPTLTRIQVSENGTGHFTTSDRITLFVNPGNPDASTHELTCTGSDWTPQLTWNSLQTDQATFTAVYPPLNRTTTGEFIHETAADQRPEEAYRSSDLLAAQTTAERGEKVQLDFYHKMNRIVVYLESKNGAFTAQELESATVSLKARRRISFDPHTGQSNTLKGEVENITLHKESGAKFQAIVCPQPVQDTWQKDGWIEIKIGERQLVYKAPAALEGGQPFNQLESGKQITFNLLLDKSGTGGNGDEIDWRNRTCWVYGVKNIPPIEEWGWYIPPKWENGKPVNEVFALEWKKEYGWYDCNKLDPSSPQYGDMNLCWAATCSNMIYWWLEHNMKNLDRYGYKGPRTYVNDRDCEVFKYFKNHFTDSGLHIHHGLEWFFRGSEVPSGHNARPTKPHAGFFKDVLTAPVAENVSFGSYDLTENLKKAFLEKKAIGVSILLNNARAAHAITIWGAGFDEKGEVNMLYVVENNDIWANENNHSMRPGVISNAGIFTKRVQIAPSGKAFIEGGSPGIYNIEIDYLTLLGLNTEEWETYFKRS